jgi:lysophospholipase L1-like esterase
MDTERRRGLDFATAGGAAPVYYLSLGDSLATGVQPIGAPERQFRTDEGYADQLGVVARQRLPNLSTVKLGYPGESTTTMIEGGLTAYPHGSQLDEAVAFLLGHRGSVAFVTIDIGFNDLPGYSLDAIPAGIASIDRNLPGILGTLQEAAGPGTPIVGMTIYDAFLPLWLDGALGREMARMSVWDAVVPINSHLRELYRTAGLRVADVEGAFATTDFETEVELTGHGRVPVNVARACQWTWGCEPPPLGPDLHANVSGYGVIAQAFERVLQDKLGRAHREPAGEARAGSGVLESCGARPPRAQ